jgi:hypothetical protein
MMTRTLSFTLGADGGTPTRERRVRNDIIDRKLCFWMMFLNSALRLNEFTCGSTTLTGSQWSYLYLSSSRVIRSGGHMAVGWA